ncbi:MAG: Gldg family protein [Deltaproteobacteria bacterium]|nr:Gldg family protein [Deltaproteobacteria bacterium]MBW2132222.1 Gldg family protein [Deltaproteobacteria bacterium]
MKKFGKYAKFLIYGIAVVLINLAGVTLFLRADLTQNRLFSLSPASRTAVSTLSEPLTIHVFFTQNLPAPHNQTERYLKDLLEAYAAASNRFFNYRFFHVTAEDEESNPRGAQNRKMAEAYGIHPLQIQMVDQDEIKFKKAYMGLVLIHGDIVERIPAITATDDLEYRLTTAIRKLNNKVSALLNLKEKVHVTLILSSSLETVAPHMGIQKLADYPEAIREMVQTLNAKLYQKLEYTHVDPTKDPGTENLLKTHDVLQLKWPALFNGKVAAGTGAIGIVMTHGEKSVELPLLNVMRIPILGTRYELVDLDRVEEMINAGVERLVNIHTDLGYMADHGSPPPFGRGFAGQQDAGALSTFSSLAGQNYAIKPIRITEETIPANLGCLVIAGPTEPLSDYALFQIDQALMRGTSLMLFPDALKESQSRQAMMMGGGQEFQPFDSGLEKLLSHWGVTLKKSLVLDEHCYRQTLPREMGGGEQSLYFAPVIQDRNIDHSLDFMKPIKGLVALKVSPLTPDEKRLQENDITAYRLLSSSEKSWEIKNRITLNPMFLRPPASDEEKEKKTLAMLLEGEFPSYFAGKPLPEKPVAKDPVDAKEADADPAAHTRPQPEKDPDLSRIKPKKAFLAEGKPARVFVMASSEMLKDNVMDPEGKTENAIFVLNLLDYLNHREEIAVLRGKRARFNPLQETSGFTKALVKSVMVTGLPAGVILFGLGVWLKRRRRKKRIQAMFQ